MYWLTWLSLVSDRDADSSVEVEFEVISSRYLPSHFSAAWLRL